MEDKIQKIIGLAFIAALAVYYLFINPEGTRVPYHLTIGQSLEQSLDLSDRSLEAPPGGPFDLLTFDVQPGQRYAVEVSSANFDPYLQVGPVDGDSLGALWREEDSGDGMARVTFTPGQSVLHGVRVLSAGGAGNGSYRVLVEKVPDEGSLYFRTVEMGDAIDGTLDGDDPSLDDNTPFELYRFRVDDGDRVVFTVESPAFDPRITLGVMYNAAMMVSEIASMEGPEEQLEFTFDEGGLYNVRVEATAPEGSGPYRFRLERR